MHNKDVSWYAWNDTRGPDYKETPYQNPCKPARIPQQGLRPGWWLCRQPIRCQARNPPPTNRDPSTDISQQPRPQINGSKYEKRTFHCRCTGTLSLPHQSMKNINNMINERAPVIRISNVSDTLWWIYDKGSEKPRWAYVPQICYIIMFICIKTRWHTVLRDLQTVKHICFICVSLFEDHVAIYFCEARRASHCHSPQTTYSAKSTCCAISAQNSAMHVVVYAGRLTSRRSIVEIINW